MVGGVQVYSSKRRECSARCHGGGAGTESGGGEFIHCTAPGVGVMRVYGVLYYTKTKDESDEGERERRERWGGEERISGPIYGSVARGCRGQGADAERSVSLFLTHARVHTRRSSLVDTVITLD